MSLDDFLCARHPEHQLQISDIVLVQKNQNLAHKIIRFGTASEFVHVALIFCVPHNQQGYDKAFLIESSSAGVDLTSLEDYTDCSAKQVALVIMRYQAQWFDEAAKKRVRGEMLNAIKAEYDWRSIALIMLKVAIGWFVNPSSLRADRYKQAIRRGYEKAKHRPSRFICSGFIQYGFWRTQQRYTDQQDCDCYFADGPVDELTQADLLTVTPADIFASERLQASYVIANKRVYPVSSKDEAAALLKQAAKGKLS